MIPAFLNRNAKQAEAAEQALREAGCFDVRVVEGEMLTSAIRHEIAQGVKRIAVAGGDGTVSGAAAAFIGSDAELVVIPAGTFNHFARDHGIPTKLDDACNLAHSSRVERIDVARVNGRVFLNTSSVGVYANYVRIRELHEARVGYWLASFYAAMRAFVRVRPFTLWFETERVKRAYITPLAFIALGERELKLPRLGGRVPRGRAGLHVMIVSGRRRARMVTLAFAGAARGIRAVSRTPHLDSFMIDRCTIEQRHSTVALDGEVVTLSSPLEYELLPAALKVVVPPSTI